MEELVTSALKGLIASGPLAIGLWIALKYQTKQLEETRTALSKCQDECKKEIKDLDAAHAVEIKDLTVSKEALYERVFTTLNTVAEK